MILAQVGEEEVTEEGFAPPPGERVEEGFRPPPGERTPVETRQTESLPTTVANAPQIPGAGGPILPQRIRHMAPGMRMPRVPQHLRRIRRHPEEYQRWKEYGAGIHGIMLGQARQFVPATTQDLVKAGLAPESLLKTDWYGVAAIVGAALVAVGGALGALGRGSAGSLSWSADASVG
jgi:hypothetical protein